MTITHYPSCNANYPEKPKNEPPQRIIKEITDDGYWIHTCCDCGAFETNLPNEDDPYWNEVRLNEENK